MSVIKNKGFRIFLYILGYVSAAALIVSIFASVSRYTLYDRELDGTNAFPETSQVRSQVYEELSVLVNKAKYANDWKESGLDERALHVFDYNTGEYKDISLSDAAEADSNVSGVQAGLVSAANETDYDYYGGEAPPSDAIDRDVTFDPEETGFLKISTGDFIGLLRQNAVFYDEDQVYSYLQEPDSVSAAEKEQYETLVQFMNFQDLENGDYYRILDNGLIIYSQRYGYIYTALQGMLYLENGTRDLYIALPEKTVKKLEKEEISGNEELLDKVFSGYFFKSPFSAAYATLSNSERTLVSNLRYTTAGYVLRANTAYSFDENEIAEMEINNPTGILEYGSAARFSGTYPELVDKIRSNSDVFVSYDKKNGTLEQWYKERNGEVHDYRYVDNLKDYTSVSDESFVLGLGFYDNYSNYYFFNELAYNVAKWLPSPIVLLIISALVFLFCVIALLIGEPARLRPWDKIPYEIYVIGFVLIVLILVRVLAVDALNNAYLFVHMERAAGIVLALLFVLALYILTASMFMTTLRRIRCKTFFKSFLTVKLGKLIGQGVKKGCKAAADDYNSRFKGKTKLLIFVGVLAAVNVLALLLFGMITGGGILVSLILIAADVFAIRKLLKYSTEVDKLLDVSRQIEAGDLEVKVDTEELHYNARELGESLNNLGAGLSKAVESSIRDERTKAELITNVSHDIKTPLTSIISYVDLLKKENIENEKAREYIDVLDRKSQRLKQLILDLIEVSKTNTGNIELERMNLNLTELVNQSLGEYEEKMAAGSLEVVRNFELENAVINADGRRIFRIIDNIFNNVVKYSQPGTRVYVNLQPVVREGKNRVLLSVKNVSREMLNMSADELMERFVRGDRSRHTEGSGLGLSIAKNLTELQDGTFDISIDGDLFKVDVTFPLV